MAGLRLIGGLAVATLAVATSTASGAGGLFDYDHSAPLNVAFGGKTTSDGVTSEAFSFQATASLRLNGYFVHPAMGGPWPLVIWSPGAGGDRRQQLPEADRLAHGGAASLLLDAPPFQPGCHNDGLRLYQDYVVSRRRAVDLAVTLPDVDHAHLAAAGLSFGAEVTATLSGVEHRLHAFSLESSRGHFTGFVRLVCASLSPSAMKAYIAGTQVVDPVHWVGHARGALLMQNGTRDDLVTRADVLALYNAAHQPKELHWYVAGHLLNGKATADRVQWLLHHA